MSKRWNVTLIVPLLLSMVLFVTGCGEKTAKSGDTVKVDYTLKLSDGTVYDTSVGKQPFEFTLGSNQVIVGFEKAVTGMKVGESKTVTIPAKEAYGEYNNDLVIKITDLSLLPPDPKVGLTVNATESDGTKRTYKIIAVDETGVTLDGNVALAGKDLTFEITLVEIVSK